MSFGLPAWAASTTDWINSYGRIAWVSSGFVGVMVFSIAAWVVSMARARFVTASIYKTFYQSADRINPMDSHFLRRRIRLEDLLPPGWGAVDGKTFEDCDLIGPLNIFTIDCAMSKNLFESVDHIVVKAETAGKIRNARIFNDCRFISCRFYHVSFLINEDNVEQVTKMGGTNWITPVPIDVDSIQSRDNPQVPHLDSDQALQEEGR